MKTLQNVSAILFMVCVVILAIVSVLGVWEIFEKDVIWKSFQTIGILALVAVVVLVAGRFSDSRQVSPITGEEGAYSQGASGMVETFREIRHGTIALFIVAVVLLALLGVMAIWEVLSADAMQKSLSSIAIVAFAAFILVFTCLEREDHKLLKERKQLSGGVILLIIILTWWFLMTLF